MSSGGPSTARQASKSVHGALLMLGAVGCFTGLDSILKYLASEHDVLLLVWYRNVLQVLFLVLLVPVFGARTIVATRQFAIHAFRGLLLALVSVFTVLSLTRLPMAQTYAITFSTPLFATLLATLMLGERTNRRRWTFIVTGFVGVLIALVPWRIHPGPALLLPLAMALANAGYQVSTRFAGRSEGALVLLFHVGMFGSLWIGLTLPWVWEALPGSSLLWLLLGGVFGTLAQLLLIQAFRLAPTSIVSPMSYSQILWAIAIGYLIFDEVPDGSALIGGAIIALSGLAVVRTRS